MHKLNENAYFLLLAATALFLTLFVCLLTAKAGPHFDNAGGGGGGGGGTVVVTTGGSPPVYSPTAQTAAYNAAFNEAILATPAGPATMTVTLPQITVTDVGKSVYVKKMLGSGANVIVAPFAGQQINLLPGPVTFTSTPSSLLFIAINATSWASF